MALDAVGGLPLGVDAATEYENTSIRLNIGDCLRSTQMELPKR